MLTDRYGLTLATRSEAARDAYVEASDLVLTSYPGAADGFARAIEADPGFALAHAGRARTLQMAGDAAGARASIAQAQTLAAGASARERNHAATIAAMIGGPPDAALTAVRAHVADWPRDALVAASAANQTGLIAMSGHAARERDQLDFLVALAPHYGDDWWFCGHYGMALSELGHQSAARPLIEGSLARQPRNATAAHAMAHYHYENGERAAARAFLGDWLGRYPRDGSLYGHLTWHMALVHLQEGDAAEGLRLYTETFAVEDYPGPAMVKLFDAPSFLWRAELAGQARDAARWQELLAFARTAFARPGVAFADWHVALIDAVAGGEAGEARAREIEALARDGRYASGPAVPALTRAFAAFQRGDHEAAIDAIEPVFAERARVGGSRAQIDLIEFTLLKCYMAAGRDEDARRLLRARRPGPGAPTVAGAEALAH